MPSGMVPPTAPAVVTVELVPIVAVEMVPVVPVAPVPVVAEVLVPAVADEPVVDTAQSVPQLLTVSEPSHAPSPQHILVFVAVHALAPPPPADAPDVPDIVEPPEVPPEVVEPLQSALQLLVVSGPSHAPSPQH